MISKIVSTPFESCTDTARISVYIRTIEAFLTREPKQCDICFEPKKMFRFILFIQINSESACSGPSDFMMRENWQNENENELTTKEFYSMRLTELSCIKNSILLI